MPFTVSHTIVALPFRRTRIPAAALAIGAMAPDVAVFVPQLAPYDETHSALGALTISTPVALVVLLVWTFGLRWAFAAIQPTAVHDRLPPSWDDPASSWRSFVALSAAGRVGRLALVLGTVIVGVYSHIAWDSFTHRTGFVVERVAFLRAPLFGNPLDDSLQNISSAGGMVVLVVAWLLWFRRTAPTPRPRLLAEAPARVLRIVVVVSLVLAAASAGVPLFLVGAGPEGVLGWAATRTVQFAAMLFVALAVALSVAGVARGRWRGPRR